MAILSLRGVQGEKILSSTPENEKIGVQEQKNPCSTPDSEKMQDSAMKVTESRKRKSAHM